MLSRVDSRILQRVTPKHAVSPRRFHMRNLLTNLFTLVLTIAGVVLLLTTPSHT